MNNENSNIRSCRNVGTYAREAAEHFIEICKRNVAVRGVSFIAIPGGSSPIPVFNLLAQDEYVKEVPWDKIHVFFTDERCVAPDSPDNNFKQANDLLLSKVPIPTQNVHRFLSELSPDEAVERYEHEMRSIMGENPQFDLIVLGMGADAHVASLFPFTDALNETQHSVFYNYVPKIDSHRLTLTIPVIQHARTILVLIKGAEKGEALRDVLWGPVDVKKRPAQIVRKAEGSVIWVIDQAAAHSMRELPEQ